MKEKKKLNLTEVTLMSHENARNKSFKVKIDAGDYERAMSADMWPSGVQVRVFFHRRRREEEGTVQFQ